MTIGRNDPCPCGSGKKYKKCCGVVDTSPAPRPTAEPDTLLQQAMRLHQNGQLMQAEAVYRQLLALRPGDASALHLLGLIAHQNGNQQSAVELMGKALAQNPNVAEWQFNLASAYAALGRPADAESHFRAALGLRADMVEAAFRLGIALYDQGRYPEAAEAYRHALRLRPAYPEACYNLGNALAAAVNPDAAMDAYRQALALRPAYPQAHANLGNTLRHRGRLAEAIQHYRSALAISPEYPDALANLAGALLALPGGAAEAAQLARRAVELDPNHGEAWNNLCAALQGQGRLDEALAAGQRAVAVRPDYALAWNNLGSAWQDQARIVDALNCYRRAVELDPGYAAAHSNSLFALNFLAERDGVAILAEHRGWAQRHATVGHVAGDFRPTADAVGRPLRIGYFSPDFRDHAVAWFIEPILASHDKAHFETYCYAAVAAPDATTARLQGLVPHWRDIAGLTDDEAAQLIHHDAIDILVDLAGYTAGGRLGIFAKKPAPLQMTWLGYLNTSGLAEMDYRISDAIADPPGAEAYHTEKLLRLPHAAWCYRPPAEAPEPGAVPQLAAGHVTFAAFNNFAKTTPETLALWGRILVETPGSRLVVLAKDAVVARRAYAAAFEPLGIDMGRLEIRPTCSFPEYLALHREVDIALDSYPYNGATTTCHALWMGVPVVSLSGVYPPAARSGASLLATLGLAELCAATPEDYVAIAAGLAYNPDKLRELRGNLRERMRHSALTDASRFTAALEAAYRVAWEGWCRSVPAVFPQ